MTTALQDDIIYLTPYEAGAQGLKTPQDFKIYQEKFRFLPESLMNIITNFFTGEFVEEKLGEKFLLKRIQKIEILKIIREVLLCEIFLGDMVGELQSRLNVDQEMARQITKMILSDLFAPAIEEIKKEHQAAFPNRTGQQQMTGDVSRPSEFVQKTDKSQKIFSNPAASLDINKNNVLDLRNK